MKSTRLRLFFALGCPCGLAKAISAWRDELHLVGRPVATANLHLTLAFLGSQPPERVPELQQIAAALHPPAFDLHLDRLRWRRNGLLYLGPSRLPDGLLNLAAALHSALREIGIPPDSRPFQAHLTLMRGCRRRPLTASPSFDWPVNHFALFVSEQSGENLDYRQLHQWPLLPEDQPL